MIVVRLAAAYMPRNGRAPEFDCEAPVLNWPRESLFHAFAPTLTTGPLRCLSSSSSARLLECQTYNLSPHLSSATRFFLMLGLFLVAGLALLNGCLALGTLRYIRPPPAAHSNGLRHRSFLESIEAGIINVGNSTTPPNAAIVPVVLSSDGQCVHHPFISPIYH